MSIQNSVAVRNAMLDIREVIIGASPRLQFRTGAKPANCAAARTGTLLVDIALPADWMNAAASGVKTLAGSWVGTAVAAGTAANYSIMDAAGTTCHEQGSVTVTTGSGDMTLDSVDLLVGTPVTITTYTLTAPGA